jgi:hypothetical protein
VVGEIGRNWLLNKRCSQERIAPALVALRMTPKCGMAFDYRAAVFCGLAQNVAAERRRE